MSAQALIAPYINRIVTLINERSTAKLEICYKAGEVNINISHDLGVVEVPHIEQTPNKTTYNDILKKNVNFSQFNRIQKKPKLPCTTVSGLLSCLWRVCYQRGLPRLVFTSW